jgi:PTH2 family peptidyl-tRNA hydrolase
VELLCTYGILIIVNLKKNNKMEKDINKDRQVKQIILMRSDLGMRKGKMISAGGHAALGAVLKMMKKERVILSDQEGTLPSTKMTIYIEDDSYLDKWLNGIFTKICLKVETLEELKALYETAQALDIPGVLIEDVGLTEFKGVKTVTCASLGPFWADEIDKITKHLKLY